jgi:type I restriction enzyme S subunit
MGWRDTTLGEVCDQVGGVIQTGPFGSQLHESDYSPDGIPVVMPKDIVEGRIATASVARVSPDHVERLSRHKLEAGDIVYGRRGDIGRQALIRQEQEGWLCGTGCLRLSFGDSVLDPSFLHYYLRQESVVGWISNQAVGATLPNLNTGILRSVPLRFPPLPVQRRLAGILSAYDELIDNSQRRIRILEAMARALYREWFIQFRFPGHEKLPRVASPLGDIPDGWQVRPLNDVIDDIVDYRGKTPTKLSGEWSEEGILALSALNVKSGRLVNLGKSRRVSEDLYSRWMKNPLRRGDILMTSEAPLGELFFLCKEERYCLSQRLFSIRANRRVIASVILYLCLESEQTQHELRSRASGATVSGIRQSELRKIPILVPPRPVQERAEPVLLKLAELSATLGESIANLRRTRDLLLPRLLSGQVNLKTD